MAGTMNVAALHYFLWYRLFRRRKYW